MVSAGAPRRDGGASQREGAATVERGGPTGTAREAPRGGVVVTGAASGIGRATALAFAARGRDVIAVDVDAGGLDTLAGERIRCEAVDVSSEAEVEDLFARLAGAMPVQHLCNAAGVLLPGTVADTSVADFDRVMAVNVRGVFLVCKHGLPALRRCGGGTIVNIASANSFIAEPAIAAYCASKAAVLGLTRSLALDHAADGIRANAICPGLIDTPMVRRHYGPPETLDLGAMNFFGRAGRPEEIAQVAVFLASDEASLITGAAICVDGGATAM
jgi:NAD(P)-dependent dehydrogenase (short-subunit alcohol dehydrogenase family)